MQLLLDQLTPQLSVALLQALPGLIQLLEPHDQVVLLVVLLDDQLLQEVNLPLHLLHGALVSLDCLLRLTQFLPGLLLFLNHLL